MSVVEEIMRAEIANYRAKAAWRKNGGKNPRATARNRQAAAYCNISANVLEDVLAKLIAAEKEAPE